MNHAILAVRGHQTQFDAAVAGHLIFLGERHGARVKGGNLVIVEIGGDVSLRGVAILEDLDELLTDAAVT